MPIKLGVNSKHKLSWNTTISYGLIHIDFMLSSFKKMASLLKIIHNGLKFFIMNLVINLHMRKHTRVETNKMKKIIFSKLWEHNTYCKVKSIHFQNKRVCKNQGRGNHERSFQRLKGIISFNSPRKRLILLSQPNKRGHCWRIVGNEMSIKVSKSKKTSNIS